MTISDEPGPASPSLSLAPRDTGRERVGRAAYHLSSRDGVRAVGVDAIVAQAGTVKMTLPPVDSFGRRGGCCPFLQRTFYAPRAPKLSQTTHRGTSRHEMSPLP
jgi:hypothetical protein